MKYVAAGSAAIVTFFMVVALLVLIEDPVRNLMGWQALDPFSNGRWGRAGAGFLAAASAFLLVVKWRNNAVLKWRKTLAARARA